MTLEKESKTTEERMSFLMDVFRDFDVKTAEIKFRNDKKWSYVAHDK